MPHKRFRTNCWCAALMQQIQALFSPFLFLVLVVTSHAESTPVKQIYSRPLPATRLTGDMKTPVIDGDLSDPAWQKATRVATFYDVSTSKPVADQTDIFLLYDDKALYIAYHCHDSHPESIVARETVRDANLFNDDFVRVELDPFLTYKFNDFSMFALNPLGTQQTRQSGGRAGKLEWQGDWEGKAKRVADGWTAEMRIPWSILSYPRGKKPCCMGINFRRRQQRTQIESCWSDLGPQGFSEREGLLQNVEPPDKAWQPKLSLLPYFMPSVHGVGDHSQSRIGLDARFQPTPELTSVATLNPDFASVEGAVESVAFSRSERFVPDHRPFFLEGRNYLGLGQGYQIGSFFDSARITQVDTGFKLYGKVTPQTTLGFLSTLALGHQANFVTQLRRDINATSSVSAILLQRLAPGEDNTVFALNPTVRRGKWSVDGQVAQTLGPEAGGMAWTAAVNLEDKNLFTTIRYRRVGASFLDRLGFIDFNDYRGFSSFTNWSGEWRHGFFRNFNFEFNPLWEEHLDGRRFRHRASSNLYMETRSDLGMSIGVDGGKFDNDDDLLFNAGLTVGASNRFRQWGMFLSTGKQANRPYTSIGPTIGLRLFRHLDVNFSSFLQNYEGITQQHIITFNYQLSPYRSWGGRMVIQDSNTNYYLSFRNAGRGGMDTYFIIGDPNSSRFTQRVLLKFVFAI